MRTWIKYENLDKIGKFLDLEGSTLMIIRI